jgi:transcriptional regulator with XRE-family HTH domain
MLNFGDRLTEERKRIGLNQTDFGAVGGVTKTSQVNYESGIRSPDANYWQSIYNIGADVNYILTGVRTLIGECKTSSDSNTLSITKEEEKMITLYRRCSVEQKKDIVKDAEKYARHSDSIEQEIIKKIIAGKIDLKKLTK